MNALQALRVRSGSVYTPPGVAPDGGSMNGFSASVSAGAGLDGSVQVAGVLILVLLGIVVASHLVAK